MFLLRLVWAAVRALFATRADFFTVPTVAFRILFVFLVLSHNRRRIVHFNITEHPSAEWTGRQLVEAFPEVGGLHHRCTRRVV
jgi:hypothetical protein